MDAEQGTLLLLRRQASIMTLEQWSRKMLIDACDRILETKKELMAMPSQRDCLIVASALKKILEDPRTQEGI